MFDFFLLKLAKILEIQENHSQKSLSLAMIYFGELLAIETGFPWNMLADSRNKMIKFEKNAVHEYRKMDYIEWLEIWDR